MSNKQSPQGFQIKKKSSLPWIIGGVIVVIILLLFWVLKGHSNSEKSINSEVIKVHYEPAMIGEKSIIEYANQHIAPDYGVKLEAVGLQDSIQANRAVNDGVYTATIHQHQWWLKQVVDANGFKLTPTTEIFQWAFGVYSDKYKSIQDIPDEAKIAVPNDLANQAQALWLLARDNLIELNPAIEPRVARLKDIKNNPHHFKFVEIELLSLPRALESVDAAIGYVLQFDAGKIPRSKGIYFPPAPRTFASRLVVATDKLNDPKVQTLQKIFADPRLAEFLKTTDDPSVKGVLTPVSSQ
ncbi:MAG: MetQ/NlpA family ABC transporter substrate-binding protein [Acinetobacter sp.]